MFDPKVEKVFYGFQYTGPNPKYTGEGADLHVDGQLYVFSTTRERDKWLSSNDGEHKGIVQLLKLPYGWKFNNAQYYNPTDPLWKDDKTFGHERKPLYAY